LIAWRRNRKSRTEEYSPEVKRALAAAGRLKHAYAVSKRLGVDGHRVAMLMREEIAEPEGGAATSRMAKGDVMKTSGAPSGQHPLVTFTELVPVPAQGTGTAMAPSEPRCLLELVTSRGAAMRVFSSDVQILQAVRDLFSTAERGVPCCS
jgi:hypothetical protein